MRCVVEDEDCALRAQSSSRKRDRQWASSPKKGHLVRVLGEGYFGIVFETADGTAIKCVRQEYPTSASDMAYFFELNKVPSPLLIKTLSITLGAEFMPEMARFGEKRGKTTNKFNYVEMELCRGVTLNNKRFSSIATARAFILRLLRGLIDLRQNHALRHSNLHAKNVMVVGGDDDEPKLVDYDSMKVYDGEFEFAHDLECLYVGEEWWHIRNEWWNNIEDGSAADFAKWMRDRCGEASKCKTMEEVLKVYE